MPFLEIQTNLDVIPEVADDLLRSASQQVAAELGKPESVMMTAFRGGQSMTFGGTSEPAAMIDLNLLGFDPEKAPDLVALLTGLVTSELRIPPERIFVKFTEVPRGRWAGNGRLF